MFTRLLSILNPRDTIEDVPLAQRRRGVRFSCNFPVYCELSGARQAARLVSLSEYGARILLHVPLVVGQMVTVSFVGTFKSATIARDVHARVQWVQTAGAETQAGLAFVDSDLIVVSSWVYVILRRLTRSAHLDDDRKMIRYAADFAGGVAVRPRLKRGFEPGRIINLSAGGALFEGGIDVPIGSQVEVLLKPPQCEPRVMNGCVVRKPSSSVRLKRLGIRFEALSREQARWLRTVMEHLVPENAQKSATAGIAAEAPDEDDEAQR